MAVPGDAELRGPPAVADVNADGTPDIVLCYGDNVTVVDGVSMTSLPGFPCYVEGLDSASVVGDLAGGDGLLEMAARAVSMVEIPQQPDTRAEHLVAIDADGSQVWSTDLIPDADFMLAESAPACADLDSDGLPDLIRSVACGSPDSLKAVSGADGGRLWGTAMPGLTNIEPAQPVVVELESQQAGLEIVCGSERVEVFRADGRSHCYLPIDGYLTGLAIVDVDGTAPPEILAVSAGTDADLAATCGALYIIQYSQGVLAAVASESLEYRPYGPPVVGYLDNDGDVEVVVSSSSEYIQEFLRRGLTHLDVFTATSFGLERFDRIDRPLMFWGEPASTPAVVDADEDGHLEIWFVDGEARLHCLDTEEIGLSGSEERWSMFQRDARHTGVYEHVVQGTYPQDTAISWWGDYLLTGDTVADTLSTFLIQPGTRVCAVADTDALGAGTDPDRTELIVEGTATFTAEGTAAAPISFSSAAAAPADDDWYGVRLRPLSVAHLTDVSVSDAFIGIAADRTDTVSIRDCRIENCDLYGIKVNGRHDAGQSMVDIRHNEIIGPQVGMYMYHCEATVDSNTITNCTSHGMKVYADCGSTISNNDMSFESFGQFLGNFTGMYIQGPEEDMTVSSNEITDSGTCGILYELHNGSWGSILEHNVVTDDGSRPSPSKGIAFYDATAVVRWNTISGKHTAFWMDAEYGPVPDLGTVVDTLAFPDTTGHNNVDGEDATYCVWAGSGCQQTVMAEANYWGRREAMWNFYGSVDWEPYLESPPSRQGGADGGDPEGGLPAVLQLTQNRPNPFNPVTTIRYGLPARGAMELAVYDVAGRVVRVLADGERDPGWYEVVWDGRDTSGQRVGSGVYFCRLSAGSEVCRRKVVLLK